MFKICVSRCAVFAVALLFTGAVANATITVGSPDDFQPSLVYNVLDGSLSLDTGLGTGGPGTIYNVSVSSDYGIFYPGHASSKVWYATDYSLVTLTGTPLYDGDVIGEPGFMGNGEQLSFLMDDLTFIFQTDPFGSAYYGDLVYDTGIVEVTGDQNGDGFVGIDDLNIVLGAWNQSVPPGNAQADPSNDGFVGIDDLNIVLGNWNGGIPPAAVAVPEPGSALLLVTALGVGMIRRTRS